MIFQVRIKAFSSKRGLFFAARFPNSTRTNPPPPPPLPPPLLGDPLLGFSVTPFVGRGRGGGGVGPCGIWEAPRLVAHDCGYPLCRATRVAADFLDCKAFCRCSTGVALHPLKILVSHLPPPVPGGVAPKLGCLKRCRATRGCRSYSCGCRATLCN